MSGWAFGIWVVSLWSAAGRSRSNGGDAAVVIVVVTVVVVAALAKPLNFLMYVFFQVVMTGCFIDGCMAINGCVNALVAGMMIF